MSFNQETGMYEGYIYKIVNDINEKIYVGQTTTTINLRWNGHLQQLKKHTYTSKLYNSMELHGKSHFKIIELEKYSFENLKNLINKLDEREIFYIEKFNSYYKGYNSTKGGRGGSEHQMRSVQQFDLDGNYIAEFNGIFELKEKFKSVSTIYDACANPEKIKYAYGYIWKYTDSDYPIQKLTISEKEEASNRYKMMNRIIKYDYRGNYICTYNNSNDVLKHEKIKKYQLYNCCTGKGNFVINFCVYRFYGDDFNKHKINREKPKLVEQYDLFGNFIAVYESTHKAENITGIASSCISGCCRGEHMTSGGFIWKYVS